MRQPDLLKRLALPARDAAGAMLDRLGVERTMASALLEALDFTIVVALAWGLVQATAWLSARTAAKPSPAAKARFLEFDGATSSVAALAALLLGWIWLHPSVLAHELFQRGDHLVFAALAGWCAARIDPGRRNWVLGALSVSILVGFHGVTAVVVVVGGFWLALGAARSWASSSSRWAIAVDVTALVLGYAACWALRPTAFLAALQTYGMLSMLSFRLISATVAIRSGARPTWGGSLCYLTFYPSNAGLLGGPEIYPDFARRNLGARLHPDGPGVVARFARGCALVWLANRIPASFETLMASRTTLALWENVLLLYVATALRLMGFWACIEAVGLLYGFRLQPNFVGMLTRTNPAEMWWAWRSTFTNWLVRYVYSPLGANQRHQARNVLAAFAVSWAWHAVGVPFIGHSVTWIQLAPITIWAMLNSMAVIAHQAWQRRAWRILPESTPEPLRRAVKIALVSALASFNVAPLLFQGDRSVEFDAFLRLLIGIDR